MIGFVTSAKMHFQSYRKILFYSIEAAAIGRLFLDSEPEGYSPATRKGLALTGFSGNATMPGPDGEKADCS